MGKIITVSSGKGGTGKTTTVAAVSSCLAALKYKTLCIDFDVGLKNLDLSLGMADFAVADFVDVISGQLGIMDACYECPQVRKLFFLAAPMQNTPIEPDSPGLKAMFDSIRSEFDYCLIDAPSGVGNDFMAAHSSADMSLIVTTGEAPSIRDAQRAADLIREMGISEIRLLVNRVLSKNFSKVQTTIDDVINTVGAQLIGVVREDNSVFLSLHEGTPLVLYKKRHASYDFLDVARRITGERVPLRFRRGYVL